MKRILFLLILLSIVVGCAARTEHRDAKYVRSGLLKQGIDMQAFLDVWGYPDRTRVISITDTKTEMYAKWSSFGGEFLQGRKTSSFQEWEYEKLGISLLFDGEDLTVWKTDKTVAEIKSIAKPLGN